MRVRFAFFGPDSLCRITLFSLSLRHLPERMFFAGYAKQQHGDGNSNDALADERSHDALAQLSVSGAACKDESARVEAALAAASAATNY